MKRILSVICLSLILSVSVFAKKHDIFVDIHKLAKNFPSSDYDLKVNRKSLIISKKHNMLIISFFDLENFSIYKETMDRSLKELGYSKLIEEKENVGYKDKNNRFAILKNDSTSNLQYLTIGSQEYVDEDSALDLEKFLDCTDIDI